MGGGQWRKRKGNSLSRDLAPLVFGRDICSYGIETTTGGATRRILLLQSPCKNRCARGTIYRGRDALARLKTKLNRVGGLFS